MIKRTIAILVVSSYHFPSIDSNGLIVVWHDKLVVCRVRLWQTRERWVLLFMLEVNDHFEYELDR